MLRLKRNMKNSGIISLLRLHTQRQYASGNQKSTTPSLSDVLQFIAPLPPDQQKYKVEVAASSRSQCRCCGFVILQDTLRIGAIAPSASGDFSLPLWSHYECFKTVYFKHFPHTLPSTAQLSGITSLSLDDVDRCLQLIGGEPMKLPQTVAREYSSQSKALTKTMEQFSNESKDSLLSEIGRIYGDTCQTQLSNSHHHSTKRQLAIILADTVVFGILPKCPTCKHGLLCVSGSQYGCIAHIDEFSRCTYTSETVKRKPFHFKNFTSLLNSKVPKEAATRNPVDRIINIASQRPADQPHPSSRLPLFAERYFVLDKLDTKEREKVSKIVREKGGILLPQSKIQSYPSHTVIEVEKPSSSTPAPVKAGVGIRRVDTNWVAHCSQLGTTIITPTTTKMHIPPIAIDEQTVNKVKDSLGKSGEATKGATSSPQKPKTQLISDSGLPIDVGVPEAQNYTPVTCDSSDNCLEDYKNELQKMNTDVLSYHASLSATDIGTGKNSFYVLQVVESRAVSGFYVFRRWGRVGDDSISGSLLSKAMTRKKAVSQFAKLFEEKTGNEWGKVITTKQFIKKAGKMNYLPQHYKIGKTNVKDSSSTAKSDSQSSSAPTEVVKFDSETRKLVERMFDTKQIQKAMSKMDVDIEKLPLGNLSASTLNEGKKRLKDIADILTKLKKKNLDDSTKIKIRSLTNQFYSFVPQHIPPNTPPEQMIINTEQKVAEKVQLVDDLTDIVETKNIVEMLESVSDPLVQSYKALNSDLVSLLPAEDEFKLVEEYFHNTQGSTHHGFSLKHVWSLRRHEEVDRFKPWEKEQHRQLLWHGSRFTNWVRILSLGLKIAPPDAPVSGYMFGKGIYFADMMSKSANYCRIDRNETGLMALCEVALGKTHNLQRTDSSLNLKTVLSKGCRSVYAVGSTMPQSTKVVENGLIVPCGKPGSNKDSSGGLYYNEYIVYAIEQVRLRYLLSISEK